MSGPNPRYQVPFSGTAVPSSVRKLSRYSRPRQATGYSSYDLRQPGCGRMGRLMAATHLHVHVAMCPCGRRTPVLAEHPRPQGHLWSPAAKMSPLEKTCDHQGLWSASRPLASQAETLAEPSVYCPKGQCQSPGLGPGVVRVLPLGPASLREETDRQKP